MKTTTHEKRKVQNIVRTRRPSSPGASLALIASELGMTQGQVASALRVSRVTVNELMNGRRSVTPDMALRLARVFGSSPRVWLSLQMDVDLWDAEHSEKAKEIERTVQPLQRAA